MHSLPLKTGQSQPGHATLSKQAINFFEIFHCEPVHKHPGQQASTFQLWSRYIPSYHIPQFLEKFVIIPASYENINVLLIQAYHIHSIYHGKSKTHNPSPIPL